MSGFTLAFAVCRRQFQRLSVNITRNKLNFEGYPHRSKKLTDPAWLPITAQVVVLRLLRPC